MDWEDIKDLLGVLALYVWFFGMGIVFIYMGFEQIGNIYQTKNKRTGEWVGSPYGAEWYHSIPFWFTGIVFIGIGFWFLSMNRTKK